LTDKIVKEISKNINLTDKEIAFILKKKYPKIFQSARLDSLRRRIGTLREENNLNKKKSYREDFLNDIKEYLIKYNGSSLISISKKLHLKYPFLKLRTIETNVHYKNQWET